MDYIYNNDTHKYEIVNYDEALQSTSWFIKDNAEGLMPVVDDITMKVARAKRTVINNKLKEVQKFRKQINGVVMGEFNRMSLDIEKMLSEESDRITDMMEAYKPKIPVYVFKEIKTTDKVAYDKLVAYAKELNLLKEEKE